MKNKGFILMDVLVGLFIFGLVLVLSIPLLGSSFSNYSSVNRLTEMNFLGESIYERLCSKDEYSIDLINKLVSDNEVVFDDLHDDYLDKYESKIFNLGQDDKFIDIMIVIKSRLDGGSIPDAEFKGSIIKQ